MSSRAKLRPVQYSPLVQYKERYQYTYQQLANHLKINISLVSDYISNRAYPTQKYKEQIAQLTGGEVPIESWGESPQINKEHPLERYRQKYDLSHYQLGKMFNLTPAAICNYIIGKRYPGERIKEVIERLTKGEVAVQEWPTVPVFPRVLKPQLGGRAQHPLEKYRRRYGLSYQKLSKVLELSYNRVMGCIKGNQYLSQKDKEGIARVTQGEVSIESWPVNPTQKIPTHPLEIYKEKYDLTYEHLSKLLGIPKSSLHEYVSGKSYPSQSIKVEIEELSKGEVSWQGWPKRINKQNSKHPLEAYREKEGLSYRELGTLLNLPEGVMKEYIKSNTNLSEGLKQRIEKATGGEVATSAWGSETAKWAWVQAKFPVDGRQTHPLEKYRAKYGLSYKQLGAIVELSKDAVVSYVRRKSYPSEKIKQQIERLTEGEVLCEEWLAVSLEKVERLSTLAETEKHPLQGYKEKYGLTYGSLSRQLQLSTDTIYRYIKGIENPSEIIKQQIEKQTEGEVGIEVWPPLIINGIKELKR